MKNWVTSEERRLAPPTISNFPEKPVCEGKEEWLSDAYRIAGTGFQMVLISVCIFYLGG